VNPDELRAWVFSQAKKRPLEWHSEEGKAEWPDTFPHFAESHRFRVSLSIPRTSLIWDFSGGYSLRVNVFLNPDGTPVDVDEYLLLANGITIDFLAR
jgi:hypothetical protein